MGKKEFNNYGSRALTKGLSQTEIAGRYLSQTISEKRIIADVIEKLNIQPEDRFLDVGCGPGLNLVPVSYMCSSSYGIDHPEVIRYLSKRIGSNEINLIGGDFLEISLEGWIHPLVSGQAALVN
jgi:protein-L-isoaspartate O-methyltransferase